MKKALVKFFIIINILILLTACQEPAVQIDFRHLPEISTQNYFVICPPNYCNTKPNEISPVFPFNKEHLNIHWQEFINKQPRIEIIAQDKEKMEFTYVQRSKYLRLPTIINIQLLPIDEQHSTLAMHSQSKYGWSDFGGNKSRCEMWMQELIESIGKMHKH